jgi:hypothetical protein
MISQVTSFILYENHERQGQNFYPKLVQFPWYRTDKITWTPWRFSGGLEFKSGPHCLPDGQSTFSLDVLTNSLPNFEMLLRSNTAVGNTNLCLLPGYVCSTRPRQSRLKHIEIWRVRASTWASAVCSSLLQRTHCLITIVLLTIMMTHTNRYMHYTFLKL